jgi:hypothetical protein
VAIGHEFNPEIMPEEINVLIRVELWAEAVDADDGRSDDDSRVVPIAVEII